MLSRFSSKSLGSNFAPPSFRNTSLKCTRKNAEQLRFLNIHEYQSKMLLDKYGVNVQKWRLVQNPDEAEKAAKELKAEEYVVKSQIHAGGRGKGHFDNGFKGGVLLCKKPEEAKHLASQMLNHKLVTNQTSADGVLVKKLLICESLNFSKEKYFAILMDRAYQGPVMVASPSGGMDIEHVAEKTPHLIFKEGVDLVNGPTAEQTKRLAEKLGFSANLIPQAQEQMKRLFDLFVKCDATQVEINPFVETDKGRVVCIDAKINFDDNAAFRQKEIFSFRDPTEEDPREVAAFKY